MSRKKKVKPFGSPTAIPTIPREEWDARLKEQRDANAERFVPDHPIRVPVYVGIGKFLPSVRLDDVMVKMRGWGANAWVCVVWLNPPPGPNWDRKPVTYENSASHFDGLVMAMDAAKAGETIANALHEVWVQHSRYRLRKRE